MEPEITTNAGAIRNESEDHGHYVVSSAILDHTYKVYFDYLYCECGSEADYSDNTMLMGSGPVICCDTGLDMIWKWREGGS